MALSPLAPRRARAVIAATSGIALGVATIATGGVASAAPPTTAAPPAAASAAPTSVHRVTLITGDRVTVTDLSDGTHAVEVDTALPGAGVQTFDAGGDLLVVPDAAEKYVAAGVLDRDLFNVSLLIEDGYDDASVDATPVIVEKSASSLKSRSAAPAIPGLDLTLSLPSISGAAGTVAHDEAADSWAALTSGSTGASPLARSFAASTPTLAGGIEAIHLDGKVKASLDTSVPYIHAPEAWAEGFDGAGVTVAVLDTGYDDTHPDLAGRVLPGATSFVPGQDVAHDVQGHGTHVASTIAGTGAASDGKYRGVADGANLLIGKVLGDDGYGQDSWIIAGMEWAAERAPIVSMSLGSQEPSDGTDVMSKALDEISEETGALFVVAAGNSSTPGSVGSPGAAVDALTVGSVDDPSGFLSWFSSQGPLFRSGALKPDIAGPGSNVTAARSADSAGSGSYVSMSGTSMATPHVAGAAAIIKQRYPDYTAAELRAALTSTATDVGLTSYQAGAGVVNVQHAIDGTLVAAGSGDFGMVAWGQQAAPVSRTIDLTNRGDAELTVDLAATLADTTPAAGGGGPSPLSADPQAVAPTSVTAPEGVLTMDADQLVIPAGESRSVTLTADPSKIAAGHQLTGSLVASVDGTAVARTALAVAVEDERYDLTLTATGFDGQPADTTAWLWDAATQWYTAVAVSGETTLHLPAGTYSVMSFMDLHRTPDTEAMVLVGDPHVALDKAATVALDARKAKKVTVDVGRKGLETAMSRMDYYSDEFSGSARMPVFIDEMWAQPTAKTDGFEWTTRWRLTEPLLTVTAGKDALDVIPQVGSTLLDGTLRADAVNVGTGSAAELAAAKVKGKVAVATRSDAVSPSDRAAAAAAAGAKMLIVANDADPELSEWVGSDDGLTTSPIPVAAISGVQGRALLAAMAKKTVSVSATGVPYSDSVYDIARYSKGSIPSNLAYKPSKLARIDTTLYGDQPRDVGEFRYDFIPGQQYSTGLPMLTSSSFQRTDWVNTDQLRWYQDVSLLDAAWEVRDVIRTFKPGERTTAEYFGSVVRPYIGPGFWAPNRTGGYAQVNVPSWSDGGDPLHTGTFDVFSGTNGVAQQTDVYLDGVLKASTPYQSAFVSDIPDGTATWRVVNTATHDETYLAGSPKTVTEWNFALTGSSTEYAAKLLPMIQAYFDVDLDRKGLAGAGRRSGDPVEIGLELNHIAGATGIAKITSATLEVRTDGGAWKPVKLATLRQRSGGNPGAATSTFPTGREFLATTSGDVKVSDKGGWIDLRVTAKDAAGSTFSQEITHAVKVAAAEKKHDSHGGGHGGGHGGPSHPGHPHGFC